MIKKLLRKLILFTIEFIEKIEYQKIDLNQDDISKKILNSLDCNFDVFTDTGWEPAIKIHLTQPYYKWKVKTEFGKQIECADNHIIFDKNMNEIFVKDLKVGDLIQTKDGLEKIISLKFSKSKISMFDLTVNSKNHRYYTNDILSHNTICSGIFIAWYLCFHTDRNILVLANKMDTTKEIIDKIKIIYQNLPFFLKPGIIENAKTQLKFDNGVRLFSQATTKTAAIGFAIHLLYADEFAHIHSNYIESFWRSTYPTLSSSNISRVIITSTPNGLNKFHQIYQSAIEGTNEFKHQRVDWWQVPGRDEEWKRKEIANLGSEELFNQEYGNQFLASSRMLLNSNILLYLKRTCKKYKWKEVFDFDDFEGAYDELKWHPEFDPNTIDKKNDRFVVSIDLGDGVGSDYTIANIFKIETQSRAMIKKIATINDESSFFRLRQVGLWRSNTHSVDDFAYILETLIFSVLNADIVRVVLEINFKGDVLIKKMERNREYYPEIFMHTQHAAGHTYLKPGIKIKADNKEMYARELKNLIKIKRLIPTEMKTFEELGAFGLNSKGRYEAQSGHDDLPMSLINLVPYFDNDVFYEFVSDIFDNQPELVKKLIADKIDGLPDENDTIENIKWLREYM